MGISSLFRRAGVRALGEFHSFTGGRHGRSSRAKRIAAVRAAACHTVDTLESRVLLSSAVASTSGSAAIDLAISPDSGAVSMEIDRSTDNVNFTAIYTGGEVTSYHDSALASDSTYYYSVFDADSDGNPLGSASASATTAPAAPSFSASNSGSAAVQLSGISVDSNATSMQVYDAIYNGTSTSYSLAFSGAVQTSLAITGLSPDTNYALYMTASNSANNTVSDNSSVATVETSPAAPTFSVSSTGSSSAQFTMAVDSSATSMQIYQSTDDVSWTLAYNGAAQISPALSGLGSNSTYYFYVTAANSYGTSDSSSTASAITKVSPPVIGVSSAGSTSVDASVSYDSSATSMSIYQSADDSSWSQVYSGSVANNVTLTGLSGNTQYYFYATASNTGESSDMSSAASTFTAPAAPTFSAGATGSGAAEISSIICGYGSTSMQVYESTDESNWYLAYSGSVQTSCAISGLSSNTQYYFYMTDGGTYGTSDNSSTANATTFPAAPSFSVNATGSSAVQVSGITCDSSATTMAVYYSTGGVSGLLGYSGAVESSVTITGLSSDQSYAFYMVDSNGNGTSDISSPVGAVTGAAAPSLSVSSSGSSSVLASITYDSSAASMQIYVSTDQSTWTQCYSGGVQNSCSITGLSADTPYYFRMTVSNSVSTSDLSSVVSATVGPISPSFNFSGNTSTAINLATIACDTHASAMQMYYSTDDSNWYFGYSGTVAGSCSITGLTSDTLYYVYATDSNSNGASDPSTAQSVTTPPAPPMISASSSGTSAISVSLGQDSAATNAQIYYSADDANWSEYDVASTNSFVLSTLSPNTVYYVKATDSNSNGTSDISTVVSCSTGPTVPTFAISETTSYTAQLSSISHDSHATLMQVEYSTDDLSWYTAYSGSLENAFSITSLSPNTQYYVAIVDSNGSAVSDLSSTTFTTMPAPPTFSIASTDRSSIQLSSILLGAPSTNMQVYDSVDGTHWTEAYSGASASTYSITGLAPDVQYYVYLTSSDSYGGILSDASGAVSATTEAVTSSFTATPVSDGGIDLDWYLTVADSSTSIAVQRSSSPTSGFSTIATLGHSDLFYMDHPATEGTHYYYRLAVSDSTGTYDSQPVDAWTVPTAPTALIARAVSASEIDLSWSNHSANAQYIEIDRSTSSNPATFSPVTTTLTPGTDAFADTGLTTGTTYYYEVRALRNTSASDFSNIAFATPVVSVSAFTPVTVSAGQLDLAWTLAVTDATNIEVDRATNATGPFTAILTNLPGDATQYSDTDPTLAVGTQYYYRLLVTQPSGTSIGPTVSGRTAPAAPSDLSATNSTNSTGKIDLSWTNDAADSGDSIEIDRGVAGSDSYTTLVTLTNQTSSFGSYSDQSAAEGMDYDYRVRALAGGVYSDYSNTASASTAPIAPSSLANSNNSDGNVVLTWTNHSTNATGIEIQRGDEVGNDFQTIAKVDVSADTNASGSTGTFIDTTGIADTRYRYQLVVTTATSASSPTDPFATGADALFGVPAPSNLTATVDSNGNVTLDWTGFDYGSIIQYSVGSSDHFTPIREVFSQTQYSFDAPFASFISGSGGQEVYFRVTNTDDITASNVVSVFIPPAISFGVDWSSTPLNFAGAVDLGNTVTLETSSSESVQNWIINWGDGSATSPDVDTVAAGSSLQHSYSANGLYTISMSAETDSGFTFTVNPEAPTWRGNANQVTVETFSTPVTVPYGSSTGLSISAIPTQIAIVGQPFVLSAAFTNTTGSSASAAVDWFGDGTNFQPATISDGHITATLGVMPAASFTGYLYLYQGDENVTWAAFDAVGVPLSTVSVNGTSAVAYKADMADPPTAPVAVLPIGQGDSGVADYDSAGNNIAPSFAAGMEFDSDGNYVSGSNAVNGISVSIAPLDTVEIDNQTVTFHYAGSDPTGVTRSGSGTPGDPYIYSLPNTNPFRLWSLGSSDAPEYLAPDTPYPLSSLGGLTLETVHTTSSSNNTITFTISDSTGNPNIPDQKAIIECDVAPPLNVAIDSDNTLAPGDTPSAYQSQAPDALANSGKVIVVNDGDKNGNGVPDFADGYSLTADPTSSPNTDDNFVPLVVTIPDNVDVNQATLNFVYDASDPMAVVRPNSAEPNIGYTPAAGSLRLWNVNGNEARSGYPLQSGGNFIDAYQTGTAYEASDDPIDFTGVYSAASLGFPSSGTNRSITLYVEAVRPSERLADLSIQVNLTLASPADPGGTAVTADETATVRLTAIQDTPFYYGSSANVLLGDASGSDGGDPMQNSFDNAVNLADLTVSTPAVTDLSSNGFGQNFGMTRVWTDRLVDQLTPGTVGNGWIVSDLPTLVNATTTVIANIDGNSSLFFDVIPGESGGTPTYQPRFFSQETLAYTAASGSEPSLYTLTDTLGNQFVFYGFDASLDPHQRGQFKSFTSAAGKAITTTYNSDGQLESVSRADGAETWDYTYNTRSTDEPYAPDQLSKVTLTRTNSDGSSLVEQVAYTYYADGDSNGNKGDLKTAELQKASGDPLATYYYRYFLKETDSDGNPVGFPGLKLALGPTGYERFVGDHEDESPDDAGDSTLEMYADDYFADGYNDDGSVDAQWIGGMTSDSTDTSTAVEHDYDSSPFFSEVTSSGGTYDEYPQPNGAIGMNVWSSVVTTSTDTDAPQTVFSNYAGEVMLQSVLPDTSEDDDSTLITDAGQTTGFIYDDQGRLTLTAMPSAVDDFEPTSPDLLDQKSDGTYRFLSDDSGLINQTIYADTTTATSETAGNVQGYVEETDKLHGDDALSPDNVSDDLDDGSDDPICSVKYLSHLADDDDDSGDGADIYVVGTSTQYAGTDKTQLEVTSFAYPQWNNLQPSEIVTTPPTVPTSEDGTGTAQPSTVWFDAYGNPQWSQDTAGRVSYSGYDNATGAQTLSITDADPTSMPTGITPPDDLTRPSTLPTAHPLTTTTVVDNLGRPTSVMDANDKTTDYVYTDSATDSKVVITPPTGPVEVTDSNFAEGWTDSLTETSDGTVESLTRQLQNVAGEVVTTDNYTNLTGVDYSDNTADLGQKVDADHPDGNFEQTTETFTPFSDTTTDGLGNSTVTTDNAFGEPVEVQKQNFLSDDDIDFITLETEQYDADGNLIQTTDYPGKAPDDVTDTVTLSNEAPQVTDMLFDWKDEQVATESGVGTANNQISFSVLDNLGNATTEEEFSGKNIAFADPADDDGEPTVPTGAKLVAETVIDTNVDGEVVSETTKSVDPTTGAVSGGHATENTYDADGNIIASEDPNGIWTKTTYNDDGEVSAVYTTDGAGDDPTTPDGDIVFSQKEFQYDDDGNAILTTTRTRLATASSDDTGALDTSDSNTDYVADYYDSDGRQTDEADFGDDDGTAMTVDFPTNGGRAERQSNICPMERTWQEESIRGSSSYPP